MDSYLRDYIFVHVARASGRQHWQSASRRHSVGPIVSISLGGVSDPQILSGSDPAYVAASNGAIAGAVATHGTNKLVFHLDEVDKAATNSSVMENFLIQ